MANRVAYTRRQQDRLDARAKKLRLGPYMTLDNWRVKCHDLAGPQFVLGLDPSGVSQKLSGYLKVEKLGSLCSFKKRVALAEIQEALKKCKIKHASNARFCDHIADVQLAAREEYGRIREELYYDILEGKNKKHAEDLRIMMRSKANEANLDFVLDVQTAEAELVIEPDKNKRMAIYGHIQQTDRYLSHPG